MMTMSRFLLAFLLAIIPLHTSAEAQLTPSSDKAEFRVVAGQDKYSPGESFRLLFEARFDEGWHSQSHTPTLKTLVPTVLTVTSAGGISFGRVVYPPDSLEKFEFSDEPLATYKGTVYFGLTGAIPKSLTPGKYIAHAALRIQACDDKSCLPPSTVEIDVPIIVAEAGAVITPANSEIYAANTGLFETGEAPGSTGGMDDIRGYVENRGLLFTLLIIFIGGLALNLTPCVYPLIPITISYFGGREKSSRGMLISNALLYLLGMAVMYSALGVIAALTGGLFGAMLQNWIVITLIAGVMIGLALSMFGVWEIRPPAFLAEMGGKNREGLFGAFMMGLTAGIIAAPCVGPFVLGLLTFVGEKGDPALGLVMFFTLAIGLGAPLVFLAVFSGSISMLPRAGVWMIWVRQVFGFVLVGMALYFMEPMIPKAVYPLIFGAFIIMAGLFLGWISKQTAPGAAFRVIRYGVGAIAVMAGVFVIVSSQSPEAPSVNWEKITTTSLEKAMASGNPVIIDFTADWCLPCKELEHYTFSDPRVVELSPGFVTLRADLTVAGDDQAEKMKSRFGVAGVPTVLFLGKGGKEREELRFVGFVDADVFLDKMKKALE